MCQEVYETDIHIDGRMTLYALAKISDRFSSNSVSSLIRVYSRPAHHQMKEETESFHLATLSLKTDPY